MITRGTLIDEREAALARIEQGMTERERQEMALRVKSPKRSPASQDDASGLELFIASDEPGLI